jgi:hypothetical protein
VLTVGEQYIHENPELFEEIPDGAQMVLLPQDDPELYRINLDAAQKRHQAGDGVLIVYVEIEALAPPRSRLVNPRMTTTPTSRSGIA